MSPSRSLAIAVVLALPSGCATYDSVDEACRDRVPGDRHGSAEAADLIGRIGCYRRYVGLNRANIDRRITEAVESHVDYLRLHPGWVGTGQWQAEEPNTRGYTGRDAFERLYASEFLVEGVGSAFVWEVLLPIDEAIRRRELVDLFMHDPFVRDVFLAPAWEGAGYAEGRVEGVGEFAYMNIVMYFPSGSRSNRPVVYPHDGQTQVPVAWTVLDPGDPNLADLPPVAGYPITFTVGSSTVGSGTSNPLDVHVLGSRIDGPDGPVPPPRAPAPRLRQQRQLVDRHPRSRSSPRPRHDLPLPRRALLDRPPEQGGRGQLPDRARTGSDDRDRDRHRRAHPTAQDLRRCSASVRSVSVRPAPVRPAPEPLTPLVGRLALHRGNAPGRPPSTGSTTPVAGIRPLARKTTASPT